MEITRGKKNERDQSKKKKKKKRETPFSLDFRTKM